MHPLPLATFTAEHWTPTRPLRYAVRWLHLGNHQQLRRDRRAGRGYEHNYQWLYLMTSKQAAFARDLLAPVSRTAAVVELEYPLQCTALEYQLATTCRAFFRYDDEEVMRLWASAPDAWSLCYRWERRARRTAAYYFLSNALRCGMCGTRVWYTPHARGKDTRCANPDCTQYRHYTDVIDWRVRAGIEPDENLFW